MLARLTKNVLLRLEAPCGSMCTPSSFGLQQFPTALFAHQLLTSLVSESNQTMNALLFRLFSILLLHFLNQGLAFLRVLIVIGVVELVHLVGDPMGVVPYELLRLVELFGFEKLLRFGVGRVGQDRL